MCAPGLRPGLRREKRGEGVVREEVQPRSADVKALLSLSCLRWLFEDVVNRLGRMPRC
ncbi:hypothetical protein JD76_05306 [Micromonospora endolithica]|nr:hypothetical protein JD76_05306 [Micromonospora endolithica]